MPEYESWVEYRSLDEFPGYLIGSDGSVWSNKKTGRNPRNETRPWRQLLPVINLANHYHCVNLYHPGRKVRRVAIHHLVALAFIGPKPRPDWLVRHLDGNPTNNSAGNLAWGSPQDNADDRERHGRTFRNRPRPYYSPKPPVTYPTPPEIAECIPVTDFPGYLIHPTGIVWTRKQRGRRKKADAGPWRTLTPQVNKGNHYIYVTLSHDGHPKRVTTHSLVARAFVGPPPANGMQICHNDGDKTNNHFSNLRWDTPKANGEDRVAHGKQVCGMNSHCSKLTDADVPAIRRRAATGESYEQIAKSYGVYATTISEVVRRRTWKHIP